MYNSRGVKVYEKSFKHQKTFTYPTTKLKNITCVFCRRQFFIRDLKRLEGSHVPLLLSCGHASCQYCVKIHAIDPCPLCKNSLNLSNLMNFSSLPVNIYVVGLVSIGHDRPVYGDEPDISFSRPSEAKLKQESIDHGHCYECGIQAVLRCLQCVTLFCHACFNKMHQFKKLQNHFKVLLPSTMKDPIFQIKTCPEHNVVLDYYCNVCRFSTCHHCMLLYHKQHDSVPQAAKNEEFMDDLRTVLDKIAQTLQRIHHTQKKLQKILLHPEKLQSSETIETAINQHFAHLHGVLQNCEKRMIDQIQEQRNISTNNLKVIQQRLRNFDDQLESALTMTTGTDDIIGRINLGEVIPKLERMADAPCHLVEDTSMDEEKIIFYPDPAIIQILENHCKLEVPEGPGFKLLKTENLPEDYELEALDAEKSSRFSDMSFMSNASTMKRTWSCQSLSSRRSDSQALREGSVSSVELCHVNHPSNFYVRQVSYLPLIEDMEEKIDNYVNTAMTPCEVQQGKMYVVENELKDKWYRGRVMAINKNGDDEETYEIFDADYGSIEHQVPKSRMRYISEMLMRVSQTVINCSIFDIVPKDGKWTPEANKILTEYPKPNKSVNMHIVNIRVNTYFVDLCKERTRTDGPSIRDSLIFLGHGSFNSQHNLLRMSPQAAQRFHKGKLELEKYYDVVISEVESPDNIYLQEKDHLNHLSEMMQKMTKYYNDKAKSNDGLIHVPEIDIPCAVEKENDWFRGIINGVPGSRMVEVFLVDFGKKIMVKYDKIRRLHESYMPSQAQAINVSLTDIKPCNEQWSQEAIDFIKQRLTGHVFRAFPFEATKNAYNVALYATDNVNIAAELVNKGLAMSTGPRSSGIAEATSNQTITKKIKPKIYNSRTSRSRKKKQAQNYNRNTINKTSESKIDPFKLQVKIIRVVSPDTIYVADPNNEEAHKEMMLEMQKFYNKYEAKINDCNFKEMIDCQCAIYSESDKAFCRGKINAFKQPDQFDVFLYDLALTETVKASDVQFLEKIFWEMPSYAFRIKLAGIYPCGGSSSWTTSSCDALKTFILNNQNCKFYMSKVDNVEKDDFSFDLWVEQMTIDGPLAPARIEINSVNRMLVERGLALPIKNYNDKKTRVLAIELTRHISHTTKGEKITGLVKNGEFKEKYENNGETSRIINSEEEDDSSEYEDVLSNEEDEKDVEGESSSPEILETNGYSVNRTVPSTEPKLRAWLPPQFIVDDSFTATPTYLDHDCCLYIHPTRHSTNTLNFIEKTLSTEYSKLKAEPSDLVWEKGDLCIAQYHANKKWYRAQVQRVLDNNMIEVEFIDYGSIEECENGTLRKRLTLAHIPRISTKCVIYGLRPTTRDGKWKTRDLDRIHGLLVERECQISVLRRKLDHLVVSVILTNPIRRELITYLINELTMNVQALGDLEFSKDEMDSTMNESYDVIIEGYVKNFVTEIKIEGNNEEKVENEEGKINEIDDEKIAKLGEFREKNEKESEKNENCTDDEETVRQSEYNELESSTFSELTNSLTPENSAKTLIAGDHEIDVADLTINLNSTSASDFITGTANFTHSPDDIEKSHQQARNQLECISLPEEICPKDDFVTSTPFNDTFYENSKFFENLTIPHDAQVVKAEIGTIHVPGLYMHILGNKKSRILTEYRDKYETIMRDMQKYGEEQPILKTFEKDTPCCAKFTDGNWYRCNVVSYQCDDDNDDDLTSMIKVSFVDFGNVDYVRIDEVRTMKEEWLEAPKMSLWCPLSTVKLHPANCSTDPRVAERIRDAYEKEANGEYQKSRVFYIKVKSTYDGFQSYEIHKDENCTELVVQPLIDEGLFIKCLDLNDFKEL